MNFNIENFKLTMRPDFTFFYVNGTDVTCKMSYYLNVPDAYLELHGPIYGTVVATAHCHEDDVFNLEVGKKVALAKAENKAYSYVKEWAKTAKKELSMCLDAIEDFEFKTERVKNHNVEYMKKF